MCGKAEVLCVCDPDRAKVLPFSFAIIRVFLSRDYWRDMAAA